VYPDRSGPLSAPLFGLRPRVLIVKPYSRLYTFIKGSFSWQNSDDQGSFSVVDQRRSGQFFRAKSESLSALFHGKK
jgi:hypothetical protein